MSSLKRSIKIREDFMDAPHRSQQRESWEWPSTLQHVGSCESVMYTSDKWERRGKTNDYKHVAEGPQRLYVVRNSIIGGHGPSKRFSFPESFAFLAHCLGVQARLHDSRGKPGDYYQLDYPRCSVGAGTFDNGGNFLIVYDKSGVHAVVTGDELDVLKDGIVG